MNGKRFLTSRKTFANIDLSSATNHSTNRRRILYDMNNDMTGYLKTRRRFGMTFASRYPSRPSRVERNRKERLVTEPFPLEKTLQHIEMVRIDSNYFLANTVYNCAICQLSYRTSQQRYFLDHHPSIKSNQFHRMPHTSNDHNI